MHKVGILRQDIAGIISETADPDYLDFGPQFVVDHKAKERLNRKSDCAHSMFWFRY